MSVDPIKSDRTVTGIPLFCKSFVWLGLRFAPGLQHSEPTPQPLHYHHHHGRRRHHLRLLHSFRYCCYYKQFLKGPGATYSHSCWEKNSSGAKSTPPHPRRTTKANPNFSPVSGIRRGTRFPFNTGIGLPLCLHTLFMENPLTRVAGLAAWQPLCVSVDDVEWVLALTIAWRVPWVCIMESCVSCWLMFFFGGCLTSQQHTCVSLGQIYSDNSNNNNDFISIALFHVKHTQLRWTIQMTHTDTQTHTRARARAHTHTQPHTHTTHTHTLSLSHTHTHTHARTRARTRARTHTHARASARTHTHTNTRAATLR